MHFDVTTRFGVRGGSRESPENPLLLVTTSETCTTYKCDPDLTDPCKNKRYQINSLLSQTTLRTNDS